MMLACVFSHWYAVAGSPPRCFSLQCLLTIIAGTWNVLLVQIYESESSRVNLTLWQADRVKTLGRDSVIVDESANSVAINRACQPST